MGKGELFQIVKDISYSAYVDESAMAINVVQNIEENQPSDINCKSTVIWGNFLSMWLHGSDIIFLAQTNPICQPLVSLSRTYPISSQTQSMYCESFCISTQTRQD